MEYIFNDVNDAFPILWHRLLSDDMVIEEQSRNGPVRRSIHPVTTIFKEPYRRVLLNKVRDANPFFHLFESVWMLAGRNDVFPLTQFNRRMLSYSDDGLTLVSSYGYRWKGVLDGVIKRLYTDRKTRRAYIPIFWPEDCTRDGKDLPCNTGISFYIRDGSLDMTVFNRSNDMVYGAYGANVVHFSFLQEYVAAAVECDLGYYAQISSNFHLYTEFDVTKRMMGKIDPFMPNPYDTEPSIYPSPYWILPGAGMIGSWQADAAYFLDTYITGPTPEIREWHCGFFASVVGPMYRCWYAFVREKDVEKAMRLVHDVQATDWRAAAVMWFENRLEARNAKAQETHQG